MNNEQRILDILEQMQARMDGMEAKMDGMEAKMDGMEAKMDGMQTDITGMKADIKAIDQRTTRLEINQENVIIPHIQLLAEGQTTIQGQVKRLSVIGSMQEDISILKSAVKYLSDKVSQLENPAGK